MGKRRYRAVDVKDVDVEKLRERIESERVVLGIDVAKYDFFAAVLDDNGRVWTTVKWRHPEQTADFLGLVAHLRDSGLRVQAVMEPSGTYGDALREQLSKAQVEVFRVSPKRTHDMAEAYDGVPSLHDGKAAAIIGTLHLQGASRPWPLAPPHQREQTAALRMMQVYEEQFRTNRSRLEALLSRHWPELEEHLELGSATQLELLRVYGGPAQVAADPLGARGLMQRIGGPWLSKDKVDAVVAGVATTVGVTMIDAEVAWMRELAEETRRNQKAARQAKRRVESLSASEPATQRMGQVVGKTTAAVLFAALGDPSGYHSATAYVKALGLNLKEKSSGTQQGGLHITKRGPGVTRLYLYLAALRLLQRDDLVGAWYHRKVQRQGGDRKSKAVVAIMRKLAAALWHVAQGHTFDSSKLYDARRLGRQP